MNTELKNRMQNGCPLLKDAIDYFESMETKSAVVVANTPLTVTHNLGRVTRVWFVNESGEEEGIDVTAVTVNGFTCRAGSAGTVYYS